MLRLSSYYFIRFRYIRFHRRRIGECVGSRVKRRVVKIDSIKIVMGLSLIKCTMTERFKLQGKRGRLFSEIEKKKGVVLCVRR